MSDIIKIKKPFTRNICLQNAHYVENPDTKVRVFIPAQYERKTIDEDRFTVADPKTQETHEFLTAEAAQEFLRWAKK